jgi:hypothetical protein
VPDIATGAAAEVADLLTACDGVVAQMLAARPDVVTIVGAGPDDDEYFFPYWATFAPYGLPVQTRLGPGKPGGATLPLSLAVGVWLLARAHDAGRVSGPVGWRAFAVRPDTPVAGCADLGRRLTGRDRRHALLVMGDGSACRGEKSPGYVDERAPAFDADVVRALATVDTAALLAVDPVAAAQLLAAGRAPWQVLAGAADGTELEGEVRYDGAPYGVQYTVAVWR